MTDSNKENQRTRVQFQIFNDIKTTAIRVDSLSGFVQNDFSRLLADGHTTKDEIESSIPEINDSFSKIINNLKSLQERTVNLIGSIIKDENILEVCEAEWFYYADIKSGPVSIINGNLFRVIDNRIVSMDKGKSFKVEKQSNGKYLVSSAILPITRLKSE